jgi:DNA-binding XRE family transcriptional regulator
MPFKKINVEEVREELHKDNPELKKMWDDEEPVRALMRQIIELRENEKKTQSDLEKLTGIKQQTISRYETFEYLPNLKNLVKIVDSLGYSFQIVKKDEENNRDGSY